MPTLDLNIHGLSRTCYNIFSSTVHQCAGYVFVSLQLLGDKIVSASCLWLKKQQRLLAVEVKYDSRSYAGRLTLA